MYPISTKRHSLAHAVASAVKELYPNAQFGTGPDTDNGFYYDILFQEPLTDKDFAKIEQKTRQIINNGNEIIQKTVIADEARKMFADQTLKLELIEEIIARGENISTYSLGSFTDLCAGPHVNNTKELKECGWKLDKLGGAYWRGNEDNVQMTRLYGIAFDSPKDLKDYEYMMEEAKKRDHKKIGKELKLFTTSELVGAGLPMLQPKGAVIRDVIIDYLWNLQKEYYVKVWTPHLTKQELYEKSGHLAQYGENLFHVKGSSSKEDFCMKPMSCPHHMQIFADNQFSYRDMPVRYFEPATVYRDEKSGQLGGLARVRCITQDDGHVFCRLDQIQEEVSMIVNVINKFYTRLGMLDYWVSLSVRDDDSKNWLGTKEMWEKAEKALEESAKANNINYKRVEGEAAFYGPKLDFQFKDAIGREWQLATIQCDFNLPERFDLTFTNEKGEKERPVVIHRAISGSLERFMALAIEHFAGAFPFWLSPVQVALLPVAEPHVKFAEELKRNLKKDGYRVEIYNIEESLGKRIRETAKQKIPHTLVIGDKEMNENMINIREFGKEEQREMTMVEYLSLIKDLNS